MQTRFTKSCGILKRSSRYTSREAYRTVYIVLELCGEILVEKDNLFPQFQQLQELRATWRCWHSQEDGRRRKSKLRQLGLLGALGRSIERTYWRIQDWQNSPKWTELKPRRLRKLEAWWPTLIR